MHLLYPMIDSLCRQSVPIDRILLFVPRWSEKEQCAYDMTRLYHGFRDDHDPFPSNFSVIIVDVDDGPMTKLYPIFEWSERSGLNLEQTVIISVDDDKIYNSQTVERLLLAYDRHPECVVGFSGWVIGDSICPAWINMRNAPDIPCDWLEATNGILYPLHRLFRARSVLREFEKYKSVEARTCDDIWISAWWQHFNPDRQIICVALVLDRKQHMHKSTDAGVINALRLDGEHKQSSQFDQIQGRLRVAARNRRVALWLRQHVTTRALRTPISSDLRHHMFLADETCLRSEWFMGIVIGIATIILIVVLALFYVVGAVSGLNSVKQANVDDRRWWRWCWWSGAMIVVAFMILILFVLLFVSIGVLHVSNAVTSDLGSSSVTHIPHSLSYMS